MNPNEYQQLAARTICNQPAAARRLNDLILTQLNHSLIGILGEGGELACLFQKFVYYGKVMTLEELKFKLMDEYGDLLWYIAEGLSAIGANMTEVMEANIKKLAVRYPDKYTDHHAQEENRDRNAEEGAMKSKAFASIHNDPRPKTRPSDHPNPFGFNDPIPAVDPKSVDGEEDIHQAAPSVGIGRFQEPPPYHMGRNPPEETSTHQITPIQNQVTPEELAACIRAGYKPRVSQAPLTWEQKLLAEPLKPNGCEKCHGSGYHRYPDFADGTPNFSDSAPCAYCSGKGVKN